MEITVLILTRDEECHITRCLESLTGFAHKIFIVDSGSKDNTVSLAKELGAEVVFRPWKNYADQFQWAIDNCGARSGWLMRMDADEYLEPDLQRELKDLCNAGAPSELIAYYIRRKVFFYEKWIRYGGFYPHTLLRIWKSGQGKIEQRWMDEHIVVPEGAVTRTLNGHIVDDNQKGITFWIHKHNSYASREMVDLLNRKYAFNELDDDLKKSDGSQAKWKRFFKDSVYVYLPLGFRATLYFLYRYVLRMGFLDGGKGFIWHFMQGFWYRLLVDVKLMEVERRSGGDPDKIKQLLRDDHGVEL